MNTSWGIITAFWYTSDNSKADYVLLAVRFPKETKFILAKSHPKATQTEVLEEMIENEGEPVGFVYVNLHRSSDVEWVFAYRTQPLAAFEGDSQTREYLGNLQLQTAFALDAAGIIKLLPAN